MSTRAKLIVDRPGLAEVARPESWPEVVRVAQAFARAAGATEQRLGRSARDQGVRTIVELYAAGFTQEEFEHVVRVVPRQSWWSAHGKRLGLSSPSIEVVRRNLPESCLHALSPQVAKIVADIQRRRQAG